MSTEEPEPSNLIARDKLYQLPYEEIEKYFKQEQLVEQARITLITRAKVEKLYTLSLSIGDNTLKYIFETDSERLISTDMLILPDGTIKYKVIVPPKSDIVIQTAEDLEALACEPETKTEFEEYLSEYGFVYIDSFLEQKYRDGAAGVLKHFYPEDFPGLKNCGDPYYDLIEERVHFAFESETHEYCVAFNFEEDLSADNITYGRFDKS